LHEKVKGHVWWWPKVIPGFVIAGTGERGKDEGRFGSTRKIINRRLPPKDLKDLSEWIVGWGMYELKRHPKNTSLSVNIS
jgi:hypothetical protein